MFPVHGVEYAFGSHEQLTTGIFDGEPKQCEGFTFRTTHYTWISYNSPETANHLCNDACLRLTGNPMPNWINLLARIGFLCNCIVSASINSTKVRIEDNKVCNEVEIKTKLRGRSNRFTSSSSSPSSSSVDRTRSHGRALLHPSSLLMLVSSSSRSIAVSINFWAFYGVEFVKPEGLVVNNSEFLVGLEILVKDKDEDIQTLVGAKVEDVVTNLNTVHSKGDDWLSTMTTSLNKVSAQQSSSSSSQIFELRKQLDEAKTLIIELHHKA
ncbi:hypothetical protein L1887_23793 [Cichorium endivia]|nr:hypothetical protein L1887_23793 [Cichorium endivia]